MALLRQAIIAFGRMNPPTSAHIKLINLVGSHAKDFNADPYVFLSKKVDNKRNPLSPERRLYWLSKIMELPSFVKESPIEINSFIDCLKYFSGKYNNLTVLCGSDRMLEYGRIMHDYNGVEFNYYSTHLISIGKRSDDNISSSVVRKTITDIDFLSFKEFYPMLNDDDCSEMFSELTCSMDINKPDVRTRGLNGNQENIKKEEGRISSNN